MIKGIIFDYGGTLDTRGNHWGKVLWHAYERQQIPVTEEQFRDAADRILAEFKKQ
jgi:putative hydrolase of the HAD superfamily